MKIFFIILSLFFQANSCQQENNTAIKAYLSHATTQKWIAGVRGGGSGVNVSIHLSKALPENIQLEKLQFETYEAIIEKKSEVLYVAHIITETNQFEDRKITVLSDRIAPNSAKLFYKYEGKSFTYLLENIKEIPLIPYPSTRPFNGDNN